MTSAPSDNGAMPSESTPSEPPKKRRSRLKTAVFAALVSCGAAAAGTYWLAASESGLRFALYRLPALGGVKIASQTLNGSLWHGFSGEGWAIETEAASLTLSRFDFSWHPSELADGILHIRRIAVGDVHILSRPVPPKEKTPRKPPASLKLPLGVQIDEISSGKITSGKKENLLLEQAALSYRYDRHHHALVVRRLQTAWSGHQGGISVADAAPFSLSGKITGSGELSDTPVSGEIVMGGSLDNMSLDAEFSGRKVRISADTALRPFGQGLDDIIGHIRAAGTGVNPRDFMPSAPAADLRFDVDVRPQRAAGLALEGRVDLSNAAAAPADRQGIPVRSLKGGFTVDKNGVLSLRETTVSLLKQGRILLGGSTDTEQGILNLDSDIRQFVLADVVSQNQNTDETVNGRISWRGSYLEPEADWVLKGRRADSEGRVRVGIDTDKGQRTLFVEKAVVAQHGGGRLNADGKLEWFGKQAVVFDIASKGFNPAKLMPHLPQGNVNGSIRLDGLLADNNFAGKLVFAPSTLSGAELKGRADVRYEKEHLSRAVSDILLGRNRIKTDGSFGKAGDRLNIDIAAPDLDKFGFGLRGQLNAKGHIAGDPKKLEANLSGSVRGLHIGNALHIGSLDFKAQGSPDYAKPLNILIKGSRLNLASNQIDHVDAEVKGTGLRHSVRGSGSLNVDDKPYRLSLSAEGGMNPQKPQWQGRVNVLDIAGAFNLKLQNSVGLEAGAERVALGAARWTAMGGSLNLANFVWDKKNGIVTKGSAANLHMAELHNFYKPPVGHDLVLDGDWDLAYTRNARGYLNIRQKSGDIVLPYRRQNLGLSRLQLQTRFQNGRIDGTLAGKTRYGDLSGTAAVSQQFGNRLADAPVNGRLQLNVPDLNALKHLMPVGHTIRGSLNAQAQIGGRIGEPQLNGMLDGDNLYYINREIGLILDKGTLRSHLKGQKWLIDSLQFARGGTVKLNGSVDLAKGEPDVDVRVLFDKYQALDKPNRRLTLSGETKLTYLPAAGVGLKGALKVDEGRFGFQKSAMPELGDDVVVIGEETKKAAAPVKVNMDLLLDLNDRFRFSGEGLDVTLGGNLNLRAQPGQPPQGVGTVRVVKGRYKAYAQDLNITKGTISFVGPLDSPNLNIRAVRNLSPVGAGVEVLGNLQNPRVTLVADEAMSEKDKLSWLILNRASSGSDGDEATLSAAAGAFLAGSINDRIGLVDDFGFTSRRSRNVQTGELNPAEQVLTVGKQLTGNLYLGYEYGIASASQSVKMIYQLTRSIQAVARIGTVSSGGEVKYVVRFD